MKRIKFVLTSVMVCACSLNMQGQSVQTPTMDLYDTGMMNMYLQTQAQTYGIRKQNYEMYVDMAFDAAQNHRWSSVLTYTAKALNTGFWNADVYCLRGVAYEELGYLKDAKAEYKIAKRNGSVYAGERLAQLKKMKRK